MASLAEQRVADLTAMLDVVMQLLLYFIFTARLINEEANAGDVHLPISQAARPVAARADDNRHARKGARQHQRLVA